MARQAATAACLVGLLVFCCSLGHTAIYYIDDGGATNAPGSTFDISPAAWWDVVASAGYAYGGFYTYEKTGITVPGTATYTFNAPTDTYYVYGSWSPPLTAGRTQTGIITVNGTSSTIAATGIDHKRLADGSPSLADARGSGFFPVTSGTAYQPIELGPGSTIIYSDLDNGRLSADVVVASTDLLIDDISTLTSHSGAYVLTWNMYTNSAGDYSYGYSYAGAPVAGNTFAYDVGAALGAGTVVTKDLEVSWLASTNRDQNVTYRITHTGGTTDVKVNQRQDASGATVGGPEWSGFRSLGTYQFDASSKVEIIATGGATDHAVAADTIALGRVIPRDRYGVVADFDAGNSSTAVDGYRGAPGKGWATAWSPYDTGSITTVTTANPIEGTDDPYLSLVANHSGDHTMRRQYQQYADVDPALPHRITWKWRFDGDMADATLFEDRIHFFGDDGAESGSNLGNSWLISWTPAAGTSMYTVPDREWWFFDGAASNAYDAANMVPSSIGIEAGTVYEFEVMVYPALGLYDASVTNGTDTFSALGLTFRNGTPGVYDWLHFGGKSSANTDDWAFSLDSVRVYVPEPATMAILLGGLGVLARRRRRG